MGDRPKTWREYADKHGIRDEFTAINAFHDAEIDRIWRIWAWQMVALLASPFALIALAELRPLEGIVTAAQVQIVLVLGLMLGLPILIAVALAYEVKKDQSNG